MKKIRCNVCGRSVKDSFSTKWKHVMRQHSALVVERMLPFALNPSRAYALGQQLGMSFRRKFDDAKTKATNQN